MQKQHIVLDNKLVKEITQEIRKYFEMKRIKTQHNKTYGVRLKQCAERNLPAVNVCIKKMIPNKNLVFYLPKLGKESKPIPNKGNKKIRAKIENRKALVGVPVVAQWKQI